MGGWMKGKQGSGEIYVLKVDGFLFDYKRFLKTKGT